MQIRHSVYFILIFSLCLVSPAFAQQAGAVPTPSFTETLGRMLPMFIIVFFIFYFLVIRPQDKKMKSQQALLESLKKGDQVVTTSGIIAKVATIDDDTIALEVGDGTRIRFERSHILRKFEKKKDSDKEAKAVNG